MQHSPRQRTRMSYFGATSGRLLAVIGVFMITWLSPAMHTVLPFRSHASHASHAFVAWSERVGATPIAVTVDERAHRVFVLAQGALTNGALPEPVGPGSVSVLDAATGALIRTTRVGMNSVQMALDVAARRLYVVNQGPLGDELYARRPGSVSVLDAATGALIRTTQIGVGADALTVDARHGRVFVLTADPGATNGHSSGAMSVLNATTGALLRTWPNIGGTALAVSAHTGRVFVASGLSCPPASSDTDSTHLGCLEVFDATKGRRLATRPLAQRIGPRAMAADDVAGRVVAMQEGARDGQDPDQYASHAALFDETTGVPLHRSKTSSNRAVYAFALSVTAGRAVVVDGPDGYDVQNHTGSADISVVETRGGRVLHTVGRPVGPYGLDADAVIDARTGQVIALTQPLSDVRNSPDGSATLTMLDARTGRLIRAIRGQLGDVALGLDASRGHLFVVNAHTDTVRMLDVARL